MKIAFRKLHVNESLFKFEYLAERSGYYVLFAYVLVKRIPRVLYNNA